MTYPEPRDNAYGRVLWREVGIIDNRIHSLETAISKCHDEDRQFDMEIEIDALELMRESLMFEIETL